MLKLSLSAFFFSFGLVYQASAQTDESCGRRLSALGLRDSQLHQIYCSSKYQVDFNCLERAIFSYRGESSFESLVACSQQTQSGQSKLENSTPEVMVTTPMMTNHPGERRTKIKVFKGTDLILAFSLGLAMDAQKKCIPGPFTDFDEKNHKVKGHGLGNAIGTSLIGWLTNKCNLGVKSMILMSAAREQMKINMGGSCEWNSMFWDGAGIITGGYLCEWMQKNIARPKFIENFTEKIFGVNSRITILPENGIGVLKDF